MQVTKRNGLRSPLDIAKINKAVRWACEGLEGCNSDMVEMGAQIQFYDGIKTVEIQKSMILSAQRLITSKTQNYTYVAARLLLMNIHKEVNKNSESSLEYGTLRAYIAKGVAIGRLDKLLLEKDLETLNKAVKPERDYNFDLLGLSTIEARYLVRTNPSTNEDMGDIIEMPQHFFMRVAMGVNLNEEKYVERVIELYHELSTFQFMHSTPTLFNSGTNFPQMSSCYGNTIQDNLVEDEGIFDKFKEVAALSKFAGGIGTDWHNVRSAGSHIQSTNGKSSGIVPFLKIFNDISVAVNQGGKRKGAFSAYIEPFHADALDFISLKKNAGDERRRAHDIFPAFWMNDLLFERMEKDAEWSFFDPKDVPHLHEMFGQAFKEAYEQAEIQGLAVKTMPANEFYREIIQSLIQTGAPWLTFKDESNRRNPQQHDGMIHNSNLCTEIMLNNKADETFVCNLGSINLSKFIYKSGNIDWEKLRITITIAIRALDNVIDINYYPSQAASKSNLSHRPIGLGVMGYAEALNMCGIDYESEEHLDWADVLFSFIHTVAITTSANLAKEKGAYSTFEGSLWSKGILTIDTAYEGAYGITAKDYAKEYGEGYMRKIVKRGMRNCNLLAIAPTATIANIVGTSPCTELPVDSLYQKANLGGTFTVVDPCLKHNEHLAKRAHDIDQTWVIKSSAVIQKWLDQGKSTNIYRRGDIKGREVGEWYKLAHKLRLKTTYYLKNQKRQGAMKKAGEK